MDKLILEMKTTAENVRRFKKKYPKAWELVEFEYKLVYEDSAISDKRFDDRLRELLKTIYCKRCNEVVVPDIGHTCNG